MVFFAKSTDQQYGMARDDLAIFGKDDFEERIIEECTKLSSELGINFLASGGRDPINSLAAARPADFAPWQACMRPLTAAYITANGNCLPCCISPFATNDYESLIRGNLFERPFHEIWNEPLYQKFRTDLLSDHPNQACASCGVYWSLEKIQPKEAVMNSTQAPTYLDSLEKIAVNVIRPSAVKIDQSGAFPRAAMEAFGKAGAAGLN